MCTEMYTPVPAPLYPYAGMFPERRFHDFKIKEEERGENEVSQGHVAIV